MPEEKKRVYAGKDVDMLTTLSTILTNAQDNQATLQKKRTNLTKTYLTDLETRLDAVIHDHLGVDNAKTLRAQTDVVYGINDEAYKAASEIKAQIESTYSSNKAQLKEVLRSLGYTDYFKDARNGDVEALINLLYQYQQNMTTTLQAELVASGIPEADIILVTGYAETLRNADVSQESFKSTKKVATAEAIQVYNDIYTEVVDKISKLARVFFPGSESQQQLFSYTGLLKTLNKHDKTGTPAAKA